MDCNFRNGKKQAWRNSGFRGIRTRAFQIIFGCFYELSYEVTHWELTRQLHCLTLHRPLTGSLYSKTQTFSHASSTRGPHFLAGSLYSRTRFLVGSHNSRLKLSRALALLKDSDFFAGQETFVSQRWDTLSHEQDILFFLHWFLLIRATDYVGKKKKTDRSKRQIEALVPLRRIICLSVCKKWFREIYAFNSRVWRDLYFYSWRLSLGKYVW